MPRPPSKRPRHQCRTQARQPPADSLSAGEVPWSARPQARSELGGRCSTGMLFTSFSSARRATHAEILMLPWSSSTEIHTPHGHCLAMTETCRRTSSGRNQRLRGPARRSSLRLEDRPGHMKRGCLQFSTWRSKSFRDALKPLDFRCDMMI